MISDLITINSWKQETKPIWREIDQDQGTPSPSVFQNGRTPSSAKPFYAIQIINREKLCLGNLVLYSRSTLEKMLQIFSPSNSDYEIQIVSNDPNWTPLRSV